MAMICVLADGETWTTLDGCMVIRLSDEELDKLCEDDGFSNDVKIQEQFTLDSGDNRWNPEEEVTNEE
jgi:hypothetical protein